MLMITRTASYVELGNGDRRLAAFDAAQVDKATLCVERAPCGAILHVLALSFADGAQPVRLEGRVLELRELHELVMEIMLEAAPKSPQRAVH